MPASRPPPLQTQGSLTFKTEDLPPISFWESSAEDGPEDLSAEDLHRTATQYCTLASQSSGTSTWKGRLQRDHGIDPYMLHWTATSLLSSTPGPLWKLGIHMLRTASDLDYTPSIITILRFVLLATKGGPEAAQYRRQFGTILDKLSRLVKAGENPDALTLAGLLRLRSGNSEMALKNFDAAIEAAARAGDAYAPVPKKQGDKDDDPTSRRRTPKWSFESDCHVERGKILLGMGKSLAATESFCIAASELDSLKAYLELGKVLPAGSLEREECLFKAAISGSEEACQLLSASETAHSQNAGSDKVMADEHLRWAAEWERLGRKAEGVGEATKAAL
ncbi:hypothetical protein B0T16DRAFT_458230 [Cercophora newfieldiana]|uniref:Uncharacterized protein n=1 Tax=Cercophora newfieldiana TaxID=92897 RepID=A0AA40CPI8_9PEZI|nr:hypothetical protein B0T16DRAFT_458230 [Cercophora newfieldiana]